MANEKIAAGVAKILAAAKSITTRYATKKLTSILKRDRIAIQEGLNDIGDADVPQLILARPNGVPAPAPDPGAPEVTNPALSLTPGTTTVVANVTATPGAGRSIVAYEVQRLIGSTWTTVSAADPVVASEVPARSTATPTKYVDPSGTLGGNAAYTTLSAAAAAAVPGDEIVVNGTFYERLLITTSGTLANPIRWRAYDYDNPPVIDGQSTINPPGWSESGFADGSTQLVAIQASYVIFDGFIVQNSKHNGIGIGACNNNAGFFNAYDPWRVGIEVYRCIVQNIPGKGLDTWKAEDYKIGGCDFSGCQKGAYWEVAAGNPVGWGSAVNLSGRDAWFVENKVRQTMGEGMHVGYHGACVDDGGTDKAAGCDGFVIRGNEFYDTWSGPLYITLGGDGVVEENTFFMTDDARFWYARNSGTGYPQYALTIGCELGQSYGGEIPPTEVYEALYPGVRAVVIRNNIVNGATRNFLIARFTDDGNYKDLDIDHNTIFCCKGAYPSVYEAISNLATAAGNEMTGVRFRNNAVLVSDSSDISITWNSRGTGAVTQGNLFSHSPPSDLADATNIVNSGSTVIVDKTYTATSSGWPNAVTFDTTKAAPFYNSSTISPLANGAVSVGVATDFYGRTRPTTSGRADIGAISLSKPGTYALTVSGLSSATQYQFRVRFREDNGTYSEYSNIEITTTS